MKKEKKGRELSYTKNLIYPRGFNQKLISNFLDYHKLLQFQEIDLLIK